jgi:type II secretory pathway pseudopilin PulG
MKPYAEPKKSPFKRLALALFVFAVAAVFTTVVLQSREASRMQARRAAATLRIDALDAEMRQVNRTMPDDYRRHEALAEIHRQQAFVYDSADMPVSADGSRSMAKIEADYAESLRKIASMR